MVFDFGINTNVGNMGPMIKVGNWRRMERGKDAVSKKEDCKGGKRKAVVELYGADALMMSNDASFRKAKHKVVPCMLVKDGDVQMDILEYGIAPFNLGSAVGGCH